LRGELAKDMREDLVLWLALPAKMVAAAAFVLLATAVAESAGPLLGAMVATLPLSAGPAYVFVALDHPPAFIAASALSSLVANAATIVFCAVHAAVAQARGTAVSLAAGLGAWAVSIAAFEGPGWTLPGAVLLNVVALALCAPAAWRFRGAAMPRLRRRWYDAPLRAGMVAALVATVVTASATLGPAVTGILALFPIVLTSLVLLLQPRAGGPAVAAVTANAIPGLGGFAAALVMLHVAAPALGSPVALALALAVSIAWNLAILWLRRRKPAPAPAA